MSRTAEENDSYKHEAIALRAIVEQLTDPCPDCAAISETPGTVKATCGKDGCYAGRVNPLAKAGDALAEAAQSDWDCTDDRGDDAMRIASELERALSNWRAKARP